MTLFGDALKTYTTVQQLPMLPAMLAMKGAALAGTALKKHTFLGKTVTVKDASGEEQKVKDASGKEQLTQKRIWRGSRFLRKHILEAGIDKLNTLSGGSVKQGVDRYAAYHAFGKKLAERNASFASPTGPSPKTVAELATRFRQGQETQEDKEKLDQLNLRYNPLMGIIVSPEVLKASMKEEILNRFMDDKEALPPDTQELLQRLEQNALDEKDKQLLQAFGLKARPDGSLETVKELPLTPLEQRLCSYFDDSLASHKGLSMQDISDEVLKMNLRTIRARQFDKLDVGMDAVFKELNLTIQGGKLAELPKPLPPLPGQLREVENSLSDTENSLNKAPNETDTENTLNPTENTLSDSENTLNPTEEELYKMLTNQKEAKDIQHISDMENPALKLAFTKIRKGKFNELDPYIQSSLRLNALGLKIQEGKITGDIKLKSSIYKADSR